MPRRRALNVLAGALTGGSVVALSPTNAPAQRSPAEAELAAVRARLEAVETSRPLKVDLPVNVKDYGAVGNGIADDTAAIQAAVDALGPNVGTFSSPSGGELYFPPGTYKVSGTISSTMIGWLVIEGSGIGSTSVQQTVDADLFSFQMSAGFLTVRNILLQARTGRARSTGAAIKVGGTGHLPSVVSTT